MHDGNKRSHVLKQTCSLFHHIGTIQLIAALKKFRKIHRKTPKFEFLFKKRLQHWFFSRKYCETFKNGFFCRTLPVAAFLLNQTNVLFMLKKRVFFADMHIKKPFGCFSGCGRFLYSG